MPNHILIRPPNHSWGGKAIRENCNMPKVCCIFVYINIHTKIAMYVQLYWNPPLRPQSLHCQINTHNLPMSSFAQIEWSICFRWETQFCFVTRRARVTNHGLAASDWGCQRLEMASLLLLSDAIWFFMILSDAIWFSTMLCCGAIWCYFKTDRPLHDALISASKET